jgi:hypothetical protein
MGGAGVTPGRQAMYEYAKQEAEAFQESYLEWEAAYMGRWHHRFDCVQHGFRFFPGIFSVVPNKVDALLLAELLNYLLINSLLGNGKFPYPFEYLEKRNWTRSEQEKSLRRLTRLGFVVLGERTPEGGRWVIVDMVCIDEELQKHGE